jgi:hypothetical protein
MMTDVLWNTKEAIWSREENIQFWEGPRRFLGGLLWDIACFAPN